MTDVATVRDHLLTEHRDLLAAAWSCADDVAADWDGEVTADREAVVDPTREALAAADVLARLPTLLRTGADVLDADLAAEPVPAPPYVVVAATGPVLRATFPDRGRLVIELRCFELARDETGVCYRRVASDPADALCVSLR